MQGKAPIYLDYAATTPVDPLVSKHLIDLLKDEYLFGNPSSNHLFGWKAKELVETSKEQISTLLNCSSRDVIFTSGATEANNLAIHGVLMGGDLGSAHAITSKTEHKSILNYYSELEKKGLSVTYLSPNRDGVITTENVQSHLSENTKLVSLSHINNETGIINDISQIARLLNEKGIVFHVDAAQSVARLKIDIESDCIDLLSVSSHKLYGPKGIGCLVARRAMQKQLTPILFGGGQEQGIRPGTLPAHLISGFGAAMQLLVDNLSSDQEYISKLDNLIYEHFSAIDGFRLNGNNDYRAKGIVNCSFEGISNEQLMSHLPFLAISTGSACNASSMDASHVLKAMNTPKDQLNGSIRVSFGRHVSNETLQSALDQITASISTIRSYVSSPTI